MTIISAANRVSFLSRRHKILERMFGDFLFCGFAWDDRHRPLRRCRRAALHIHKMSAVQIHLSHQQKHFFAKFFPRHTEQKCLFLRTLQLYSSCNLHRMRYNVDCHASRLCGRLQTAHAPCKTRPTIMLL